jgi:hypothetical protein
MPMKRRVSKTREPQVTSEAIALYERGRLLQRRKRSEEVQRELTTIAFQLAHALKLQPWDECPLDVDTEAPPAFMRSELEVADWHRSREIRYQLEQAIRARRDAAREAKRAAGQAASSPVIPPA